MKLYTMAWSMAQKRQMTARKAFDIVSNEFLRSAGKTGGLRPPALLLFEPASVCNLTCPFCKLGNGDIKREKGIMKPALVEKIVEEVRDSLQVALFTN
ncbi:MAG: hypothetical protein PHS37_09190, partial [Candidatus Omnitrophica bacterium]|nr:hypothetical protein [Candidatus Omnitrophota bacterium]